MEPPPGSEVRDPSAALVRMLETTCQQRAERRQDVERLQRAVDDYEELTGTLAALPAKVEHKVLVPFGKLAFFPGSLRHTNEVMVLLGDNYFALRSAEQAAAIAGRRAEYVRPQVAAAQADIDVLSTRIAQIRAYGDTQDVRPGELEIREPYVSDGEEEEEEEEDGEEQDEDDDEGTIAAFMSGNAPSLLQRPVGGKKSVTWGAADISAAAQAGHAAGRQAPGTRVAAARAQDSDDDSDADEAGQPALLPLDISPSKAKASTSQASAKASTSPGLAEPCTSEPFTQHIVERIPANPPPTESDILLREVQREAAHREQLRGMRSLGQMALDDPMMDSNLPQEISATPTRGAAQGEGGDGDDEQQPRVSRFMANRRRQPKA